MSDGNNWKPTQTQRIPLFLRGNGIYWFCICVLRWLHVSGLLYSVLTYQVFCILKFTCQVFWILYSRIRYSAPSRGANRHIDLTDRLYIGGIQVATCSNIDPDEDTFKWSIFFEIWPMWPNISVEKEKSRNPTRSEERQFGSTGLSQGLQQQKIQKIQNTGLSKGFQKIK